MSVRNQQQQQQQQQEQEPALAARKAWVDKAKEQLGRYGYDLTDEHRIKRSDTEILGVVVEHQRGRFRTRTESGALLWSGADLGSFCERFWFARKVIR